MYQIAQNIAEAFMGFTASDAPDALAGQALTICTHLVLWLGFALLITLLVGLTKMVVRPFTR